MEEKEDVAEEIPKTTPAPTTSSPPAKRGRGRPRKNIYDDNIRNNTQQPTNGNSSGDKSNQSVKRKRGRPRKNDTLQKKQKPTTSNPTSTQAV